MSVSPHQPVKAEVVNAAFPSRIDDTSLEGKVAFNNTTNATAPTNGAGHFKGGVGIEKDLHVGGSVFANNLEGVNTGDLSVGEFSGAASPDGASVIDQELILHLATLTSPGMLSHIAQSIAGNKTFQDAVSIGAALQLGHEVNGTLSGSNQTLETYSHPIVVLTSPTLSSISMIGQVAQGKILVVINQVGHTVVLRNLNGGTATKQIKTPDGVDLSIADGGVGLLVYSTATNNWHVVIGGGGTSSGSDSDDVGEVIPSVRKNNDPPTDMLYCGGASYSAAAYPELALKLWDTATSKYKYGGTGTFPAGTFNVPNMPGKIMRAVANGSAEDPDRASRVASAAGGNTGDNVGSIQGNGTRMPNNPFAVAAVGNHTHTMMRSNSGGGGGLQIGDGAALGQSSTTTSSDGGHTHALTGGDSETRMANVYFNFFIRAKPSKTPLRGSHNFVGSGDPNSLTLTPSPLEGDLFFDELGNIWSRGVSAWTLSATNLRGPQGYSGGIPTVADIAERDSIAPGDRYLTYTVSVVDAGAGKQKTYWLVGGITNSDWKEFAGDTAMTTSIEQSLAAAATITIADVREQRVKIKGATFEAVVVLPSGNRDGDKIYVVGTSDSSPAIIAQGGNVRGFGDTTFYLGKMALYIWDSTDSKWDVFKGA